MLAPIVHPLALVALVEHASWRFGMISRDILLTSINSGWPLQRALVEATGSMRGLAEASGPYSSLVQWRKRHAFSPFMLLGACRRCNGGGPGGGCARKPVRTHSHFLVVGFGSPTNVPCLAWFGLGGKYPATAIRAINSYREAIVGLIKISYVRYQHQDLPLDVSDLFSREWILSNTPPMRRRGAYRRNVFWRKGYGHISGGTWVLERRTAGKKYYGRALALRRTKEGVISEPIVYMLVFDIIVFLELVHVS
jgi:hypothetical protein